MHRSDTIPPPSPIEQRIDHALLSSVLLFSLAASYEPRWYRFLSRPLTSWLLEALAL
jgi:hypothetical protein